MRSLDLTAAEVRERLAEKLDLPTGYFFSIGGRVENQARALMPQRSLFSWSEGVENDPVCAGSGNKRVVI